jgi:hypothetical protein
LKLSEWVDILPPFPLFGLLFSITISLFWKTSYVNFI